MPDTLHTHDLDAAAQLRSNAATPFERAHAMPRAVYTDQRFLELETSHVFARDWFCAGRADALAEPGSYITLELADQPIAVVRDRDGGLRAFSNVCLHRMSILLQGRGTTRAITCPYHGWTYGLDGALRGAPAMDLNQSFCKDQMRLPSVWVEEWLGWVFVTLNPDIEPVAKRLSKVEDLIGDFGMTDYKETFYETHIWDTNWKVLAENFMESYHLPVCHAGTIGPLSKFEEMVCPPGEEAFNWHTILKNDRLPIALAHPSNTRLKGDMRRTTFLLALYPGLMITLTPGYFWYLTLHPHGTGQVSIGFGGGMSPDYVNDPEAQEHFAAVKTLLDEVNVEDRGCTERVYRGICADMAAPGPLSHLERPNYDFARYLDQMINGTVKA